MQKMFDLNSYPLKDNLDKLLVDKTTGKNIIFATDDYLQYDKNAGKESEITVDFLNKYGDEAIRPRYCKSSQHQSDRTKENAEVFTPAWICNKMIDYCDDELDSSWKECINTTFLEITCGEAPFLCSRYDSSTGEFIEVNNRAGIIDRKLRSISDNCDDAELWFDYALDAYKSTYGYEFQGDSLLIARINLLISFVEHMEYKFGSKPSNEKLNEIIEVISWNIFQMDGLKNTIPFKEARQGDIQATIFDLNSACDDEPVNTLIFDWKNDTTVEFFKLKKGNIMKFDFCIGNPPYQEDRKGSSNTALPVYNYFIDSSRHISNCSILITPARFLFNAGATSKEWNRMILSSRTFKVLEYYEDASLLFPNTDIKGGVAITENNNNSNWDPINIFVKNKNMQHVLEKVKKENVSKNDMSSICFVASKFSLDNLIKDYPQYSGRERRMSSNVLSMDCFASSPFDKSYGVFGIINQRREIRFIDKKYVDLQDVNLSKYKIVVPKADGNGHFGEALTNPQILDPKIGFTHSFLGMGGFDSESQAKALLKYIKTKFARSLLSVLKITQDVNASKWEYVPLQDFSETSDIDWSKSIAEIDQQLYKKYKLSKDEIDFIESHVKEMK